jgi:fumarate hydratase class II
MPPDLFREIEILKKTAALVNRDLGMLSKAKAELVIAAADEVIAGKLHEQRFTLGLLLYYGAP